MHRITRRAGVAVAMASTVVLGALGAAAPAQAETCPVIADDGTPQWPAQAFVNWSGCDLTGANFAGGDLRYANLTGATLTGANFTGAQLYKVDMTGVSAANSTWTDAVGDFGKYELAHLEGATFTRAALVGSDMDQAYLDGATFTDADLDGVRLGSATMNNAQVRNSSVHQGERVHARAERRDHRRLQLQGQQPELGQVQRRHHHQHQLRRFSSASASTGMDPVTTSGNTWVGATCSDSKPSTAHVAGDCFQPLDESAPLSYHPYVTGPGSGVNHWYTGPVTVHWNWLEESATSPATCPATTLVTVTGTVTASCTDTAGNVGTASYLVKIDLIAPSLSATISHAANGTNGWWRTAPTLTYTCTDANSGVAALPRRGHRHPGRPHHHRHRARRRREHRDQQHRHQGRLGQAGRVGQPGHPEQLRGAGPQVRGDRRHLRGGQLHHRHGRLHQHQLPVRDRDRNRQGRQQDGQREGALPVPDRGRLEVRPVLEDARLPVHRLRHRQERQGRPDQHQPGARAAPGEGHQHRVGPANTTWSTYATRTATGTYKVTFRAPYTRGYYRYAIRVGNADHHQGHPRHLTSRAPAMRRMQRRRRPPGPIPSPQCRDLPVSLAREREIVLLSRAVAGDRPNG